MNDKAFLVLIRILSIASLATAVFALTFAQHAITINEHPWVSHLFGINCTALSDGSEAREYCESSYNTRYYTLWRSYGNFFDIVDLDGGVLCGSDTATDDLGLPSTGSTHVDIFTLAVGNLGHCSQGVAIGAFALGIATCAMAALVTLYITVLSHDNDAVLQFLLLGTMTCSGVYVALYCLEINPLRLTPTFCESQTIFNHCEERLGEGFWFQVATMILSCTSLTLAIWWGFQTAHTPPAERRMKKVMEKREEQALPEHGHDNGPVWLSMHFWVQLVRWCELAILIVGIVSTFTVVSTTLPSRTAITTSTGNDNILDHAFAGKGGEMETEINLWQGLFCKDFGARLFLWSIVLDEQSDNSGSSETFGHCDFKDLFEVQVGMLMALVSAITAMAVQKDPKTMPLAYLIGFVMHFMSMVKLTWAITAFLLTVYPGRSKIDPSYCSQWIDYVGNGATCDITIGHGIYLSGAALVAVFVSFVGELTVQRHSTHGVGTAFWTLMGRVRQGRLSDLMKPESERNLDVAASNAEGEEEFNEEDRIRQAEEEEAHRRAIRRVMIRMIALLVMVVAAVVVGFIILYEVAPNWF